MPVVSDYTAILDGTSLFRQEEGNEYPGHAVFYTYSIADTVPPELYSQYPASVLATFQTFTDHQKALIRAAVNAWASISGLTIFEVPSNQGDLQFTEFDLRTLPTASNGSMVAFETGVSYADKFDIFFGTSMNSLDDASFEHTLLHEVGHALELKHPFAGDPTLNSSMDNFKYTVMSYTSDGTYGDVLGLLDKQAIQYLYGPQSNDGTEAAAWSWNSTTHVLTQTGTNGADVLQGVGSKDVINGLGGDDIIDGRAGNDTLNGGDGNDTIYAGPGNNTISGGNGNDQIHLQSTTFHIDGGAGSDTLYVHLELMPDVTNFSIPALLAAGDTISGIEHITITANVGTTVNGYGVTAGTPHMSITGSNLGDQITVNGLGGPATVHGSGGNDTIQTTLLDHQILFGDAGDDRLEGGGNTILDGGSGNDQLIGDSGTASPNVTASYADSAAGVTVSLMSQNASQDTVGAGSDYLQNISNLIGSNYSDKLTGDGGNNTLTGGLGNDTLDGGDGSDTASYASATGGVAVTLASNTWQVVGGGQGTDELTSIENLIGSSHNDTLTGNGDDNFLTGGAGNDTLNGGGGTNTVVYSDATSGVIVNLGTTAAQSVGGGLGIDTLLNDENVVGSSYDDTLTGTAGNNTLDGAGGNDTVSYANAPLAVTVSLAVSGVQNTGGGGSDTLISIENLTGSGFNDHLTGNGADNILDGGAGTDALVGAAGNDVLIGGAGNDTLNGGLGLDTASYANATGGVNVSLAITAAQAVGGGAGTDTLTSIENLTGSAFGDHLTGNSVANVLNGGAGDDVLNGGAGRDTASYADASSGVTVSLAVAGAQNVGGGQGTDTLTAIENLAGSDYGDVLTGNSGNNILTGGNGNDTLEGGAGNDTLDGGAGNDTASYTHATSGVTVLLDNGYYPLGPQDTIGAGIDNLIGIENVTGSAFSDTLEGDAGNNTIKGGAGDDTLNVTEGTDVLNGGDGNDTASFYAMEGVTANLTVSGPQNWQNGSVVTFISIENITGSILADTLTGDANANTLDGQSGDDALNGGGGNDTLFGGEGNDSLVGGDGNDSLDGYSGIDTVSGGNGDDNLRGGSGNDVVNGGAGNDTIIGDGMSVGQGADLLTGGTGADTFVYFFAADSTSTHYDTITDFNANEDKLQLPAAVTGINTAVTSGALSSATFDANLKSAMSGHLSTHHAILFTPNSGTLSGQTFLIVDLNGVAGYQSGQDLVVRLTGQTGTLAMGGFG